MFIDNYVGNEGLNGAVDVMQGCRFDTGLMRPFIDKKGRRCVTINTGRMEYDEKTGQAKPVLQTMTVNDARHYGYDSPVLNATSMRKLDWQLLDSAVLRAARHRLRAWSDLAASSTFGGFNGMSKLMLEHETMSDPGEAVVDMDGLADGRADNPLFQLEGLPLPITHSDFWFSERRLAVSRNSGTPLDTTMAEAAGRRVAEMIEKTVIGTVTGPTYANPSSAPSYGRAATVFGYTNFTNRNTYTSVTTPDGTNPDETVADVLAMRDVLYGDNMFGPYMLYHSNDWDQYMDNDYVTGTAAQGLAAPNVTLRDRLRRIEGIQDVRRLDFWTPGTAFQLLLVQMTPDVARAVVGMDITTMQWESKGGMQKNFKVMCIMVPQIRADYSGKCGIVHGTTA